MTTLRELIEYTRHSLSGFDASTEAVTALATPVDSAVTTLSVADLEGIGQSGVVEVDMELMRIKTVDDANRQIVLQPFGRGYRGSVAATHATNAEVKFNPSWSSYAVATEINGVLREIYPSVYAVESYETVLTEAGSVDVPNGTTGIISVWVKTPLGRWTEERRWRWTPDADDGPYKLRMGGAYAPGTDIRVTVERRPGLFNLSGSLAQTFTSATGLPEYMIDLIRLGVAARMAPHIDLARLPFLASAPRTEDQSRPYNGGAQAARLLTALFRQRLNDEAMVLRREHPFRVHNSGVN